MLKYLFTLPLTLLSSLYLSLYSYQSPRLSPTLSHSLEHVRIERFTKGEKILGTYRSLARSVPVVRRGLGSVGDKLELEESGPNANGKAYAPNGGQYVTPIRWRTEQTTR